MFLCSKKKEKRLKKSYNQKVVQKSLPYAFRGLKDKGNVKNIQWHLKESFWVLIWLNLSSMFQVITIKSYFSVTFVFINPEPSYCFLKILKKKTHTLTALLWSETANQYISTPKNNPVLLKSFRRINLICF